MVIRNGETPFQQAYGSADVTRGRPITADTLFDLASDAKPFTALAIAQLEARGLVDPVVPLTEVFSDLPGIYAQVRVRDLIHHLGGLPDYHDALREGETGTSVTNADVLAFYRSCKALSHPPGTRFDYSTGGYNLLATLIERASGQSYANYLHEYILTPAGMDASFIVGERTKPEGCAESYSEWPSFELTAQGPCDHLVGEGGLWSKHRGGVVEREECAPYPVVCSNRRLPPRIGTEVEQPAPDAGPSALSDTVERAAQCIG